MSTDDIVFEEVTYREPQRLRRPDLDARLACLALGLPRPGDLPIFVDCKPADAMERHALSDTSVELGGILLGKECVDEVTGQPFVWITESLEAKHYENTQASFTYTHESWQEITRERDRLFPELDIVGWYHTHPDFGIFLSSYDLFIHQHFFAQPLQVAYVIDPIRLTRGFFQWREDAIEPVGGFHLTADRGERLRLARLANDLDSISDPSAQAGAGGLSPRLEAALLTMLSRPHTQTVAIPASSPAATAMFGLLGALLGALGVAAFFWLQSLSRDSADQTEAIRTLSRSQEKVAQSYQQKISAERLQAKEAALDAVLREVKAGTPPADLLQRFTESAEQRDFMNKQVELIKTEKEALAAHTATLKAQADSLRTELASIHEKGNEELKKAETTLADNKTRIESLAKEREGLMTLVEETKAGTLQWKYSLAFWAAVLGWTGLILCGLRLAYHLLHQPLDEAPVRDYGFRRDLDTRSSTAPTPGSPSNTGRDTPPHVIN